MEPPRQGRAFTAPVVCNPYEDEDEEDELIGGALETILAQELSNEPFNLDLNAASFSYMRKEELHEIFDKILETISPEKMESIYVAKDKIEQIVEFLRILRYRPSSDCLDLDKIREGIAEANITILIPLMAWLLANLQTHKTRAYLSKFLIKIPIPESLFVEKDVADIYRQYESEMERFKAIHKERESMTEARPMGEVMEDIVLMQQDITCIRRKIDMVKSKLVNTEDMDIKIQLIRQLRVEKLKQNDFLDQETIESMRLGHIKSRLDYFRETFYDLKSANQDQSINPKSLIDREHQLVITSRHIVTETLPKTIAGVRRKIRAIQFVVDNPPRNVNDLEGSKRRLERLEEEVRRQEKILEARSIAKNTNKEILASRKKAALVKCSRQKFEEHLKMMQKNQARVNERLHQFREKEFAKQKREVEEKEYVEHLRSKAKACKQKRNELNSIRAKLTNLCNKDSRKGQLVPEIIGDTLIRPVDGCTDLRSKLKNESISKNMSHVKPDENFQKYSANTLNGNYKVGNQRCGTEPLIGMISAAQQNFQILSVQHDLLKVKYEKAEAKDKITELRLTVESLQQQVRTLEAQNVETGLHLRFKKIELERATEDVQRFSDRRNPSFKERLLANIIEQERLYRKLVYEEADLDRAEEKAQEQRLLFNDLIRLMKFKMTHIEDEVT